MFTYRVKYGPDVVERTSDKPVTFGEIRSDDGLRCELGFGDNVNLIVNGVTMPADAFVPNDVVVAIETAANTKAV